MKKLKLITALISGFLMTSGALLADDTFEYHGYSRIGKAWTLDQYGYQGDYGLCGKNGAQKFNGRLGQEGDQQYVENTLVKNWKFDGGIWAKTVFMLTFEGNANTDNSDYAENPSSKTFSQRNRQYYVEIGGLSFSPDSTVWAGKKYLNRVDIHILDWYFLDFSGVGFGFTNLGNTGFDIAYIQKDLGSDVVVKGNGRGRDVANTAVAKWENDFARFDASFTFRNEQSSKAERTHGYFVSAMYKPERFFFVFDGDSKIFAQYSAGGSAQNIWYGDRTPNYADLGKDTNKDMFCFDVVATGTASVNDDLSISTALGYMQIRAPKKALYASDDIRPAKGDIKAEKAFATARPHFAISNTVAFDIELGYVMARCNEYRLNSEGKGGNYVSYAFNSGGDVTDTGWKSEFKATPAIVFGVDKGFWARPQVRLYMNYEKISSNLKGDRRGKFQDKTSYVTWGCQAEAWW